MCVCFGCSGFCGCVCNDFRPLREKKRDREMLLLRRRRPKVFEANALESLLSFFLSFSSYISFFNSSLSTSFIILLLCSNTLCQLYCAHTHSCNQPQPSPWTKTKMAASAVLPSTSERVVYSPLVVVVLGIGILLLFRLLFEKGGPLVDCGRQSLEGTRREEEE